MADPALPDSQLRVKPPNYENIRNVPTEWIRKHGPTENCNVCKRASFHGRQHSRACIARYVKWLQEEDQFLANRPVLIVAMFPMPLKLNRDSLRQRQPGCTINSLDLRLCLSQSCLQQHVMMHLMWK